MVVVMMVAGDGETLFARLRVMVSELATIGIAAMIGAGGDNGR